MNAPLVSVYITNYNYGKYIRQSVESVLSQTLKNLELLIIDDGSTDNSKDIIEEYASRPDIKVIYQKNKGLNVTNNIALRASSGKYIVRLDADDFFEPDALKVLSDKLESDPELGLVFPDYYLVDTNGMKIGEVIRHDFNSEVSLLDQPAHGACTMIRRKFLQELGGYNEDYTCQDGYELWIKFITHYKVLNVNRQLFSYRQHGHNLTTNEEKILSTRIRIKDNFINHRQIETPSTLAIIPVRSTFIDKQNLPLINLGGRTILERIVDETIRSKKINQVVITSADKEIGQYVNDHLASKEKVTFVARPLEFARINESLSKTINLVLNTVKANDFHPQALMTLAVEFPFVTAEAMDDAVNTLAIFSADSLISVRPDNATYYQHEGSGMKPILHQEKYTKLERELLYRGVGGIALSTLGNFLQNERLVSGKAGHIVLDQRSSHSIMSSFDLQLARYIAAMD